jgi:cell division protein ZapE
MIHSLRATYDARVAAGDLQPDAAQGRAVDVLAVFAASLRDYKPAPRTGFLARLRGAFSAQTGDRVMGLYLYGEVGRGKSMLMDLFYNDSGIEKKRRVHFHHFMLEIHDRLHKMQAAGRVDDILPHLAQDLAQEAWLLCFDEFHINNIADAMILGRLFEALFGAGVIIVATSNSAPDQLYKNGLQRDRFLPFIDLIKRRMAVHNLDGAVDHRYEQVRGLQTYFTPLGEEATRRLQGIFMQLTHEAQPEEIALPVQGRMLRLTRAAAGVGFFNFGELCRAALGPADYLAIAECLHTLILDEVPVMLADRRDETMRFVTLIDTLYEAKTKLYMAAAAAPEQLAPQGEHAFAFQRTASRLVEMQGDAYRQLGHLGG